MINEVRELKTAGELLDVYRYEFQKRYKVEPMVSQNGVDQTTCKDLIRKNGYPKAVEMIEAFLRSDFFTFTQKKHPLSALVRDMNVVLVEMGTKRQSREVSETRDLKKIRIMTWCNDIKCKNWFPLDCWASRIQQEHGRSLCPPCLNSNALIPLQNAGDVVVTI